MSEETITSFSYKDTKSTKLIELVFAPQIYTKLEQLSNKFNSSISNTIRTLVYVALKNNFTTKPNYEYIPCQQHSDFITYSLPTKHKETKDNIEFVFKVSDALHTTLTVVANKYYTSIAQAVRMLISVSLQYNYDDNLKFVRAKPLHSHESNYKTQTPTIFIDKI